MIGIASTSRVLRKRHNIWQQEKFVVVFIISKGVLCSLKDKLSQQKLYSHRTGKQMKWQGPCTSIAIFVLKVMFLIFAHLDSIAKATWYCTVSLKQSSEKKKIATSYNTGLIHTKFTFVEVLSNASSCSICIAMFPTLLPQLK